MKHGQDQVPEQNMAMRSWKIHCIVDCHNVDKFIAQLFVYVGPNPLFLTQKTQYRQFSNSVCPEKVGKIAFVGVVNTSRLSSLAYKSKN